MRRLLLTATLLSMLGAGCTSCSKNGEHDGGDDGGDGDTGTDADVARDVDVVGDAGVDADADDGGRADTDIVPDSDYDTDEAELPPPVAMELVEVPHDREGLDCGPGCHQVTFAAPILYNEYEMSERYLVYLNGRDIRPSPLFLVDLESGVEYELDACTDYWCSPPAIDGSMLSYSTTPHDDDTVWTLWRYQVNEPERYPLVRRSMTHRSRPLADVDFSQGFVAWYDSFVHPAGLYAMSIHGGEVIELTPEHCLCYGDPELFGRQVVFEGWQTGNRDIWLVNIDTLEHENLVDHRAPQFDPAFDGQWAVWADGRNDPSSSPYDQRVNPDIYGLELASRREEPLCDHPAVQLYPDVRDGLVVWEDWRNAEEPNNGWRYEDIDVYLLDLESRQEVQVTNLHGPERRPRVFGRRVFFVADDRIGQTAVFMVDLDEAGLLER